MARPLRINYPGAWYHVMNRGSNRSPIYMDKDDYELFLYTLQESCSLYKVKIACYCLMSNHYHLLVHTPDANLSRFMRHLNGVYTQRINRKHKRDGSLFRGRYKAIVVEKESYLKELIRYIHYNPIVACICESLIKYPWSSHQYYIRGGTRLAWLMVDAMLSEFAKTKRKAIALYKEFMGDDVSEETKKFYKSKKQLSMLGTENFKKEIKDRFKGQEKSFDEEVVEGRKLQAEAMVENILDNISSRYCIDRNALMSAKRGRENTVKMMAIMLIRDQTSMDLKGLAKIFGAKSYRTIGTSCFRFKKRMEESKSIKKQYEKLKCSQEKT